MSTNSGKRSGKKKNGSKLAMVLARSLDVGYGESHKIRTGYFEAGLSGTGKSKKVVDIENDYKALVKKLQTIDDGLSEVDKSKKGPLEKSREKLAKAMSQFEQREVTNDEVTRQKMLDDIKQQSDAADDLVEKIEVAVAWTKKATPNITYSQPEHVTAQSELTLKSLKVKTDGTGTLGLARNNKACDKIVFNGAGDGQKFSITSSESKTHREARVDVTVNVTAPPRQITWSPPETLRVDQTVTISSLQASATGEGDLVLDPPDGKLSAGDKVPLKIIAKSNSAKWKTSEETASVKVTRVPRTITWTLPTDLTVDVQLTPKVLAAKLSKGEENELVVTVPKDGVISTPGDEITVTIEASLTSFYEAASLTGKVKVAKGVPTISWKTPEPVETGTKLSKKQLNAKITPISLAKRLQYTPGDKSTLNVAGTVILRAAFAGNDTHTPAHRDVRLMVAATAEELAGTNAMLNGSAWVKPTSEKAVELLQAWEDDDGSDPNAIKTQATKIMTDIRTMTSEELIDYMNSTVTQQSDRITTQPNGDHPNQIWKLPNGLQIRYKPKGDKRNPNKPMFCIEGRITDGFSGGQNDIAFKITPDGKLAAKGPVDTAIPSNLQGQEKETERSDYMTGTCRATHLFCCPKEDQVITWSNPEDIVVGTPLDGTQLNARALGGADLSYEAEATKITAKSKFKLKAGDSQKLKVTAAATKRYNPGEKSVTINVKAKTK